MIHDTLIAIRINLLLFHKQFSNSTVLFFRIGCSALSIWCFSSTVLHLVHFDLEAKWCLNWGQISLIKANGLLVQRYGFARSNNRVVLNCYLLLDWFCASVGVEKNSVTGIEGRIRRKMQVCEMRLIKWLCILQALFMLIFIFFVLSESSC